MTDAGNDPAGHGPPLWWQSALQTLRTPAVFALAVAVIVGAVVAFIGAEYERTRTPIYASTETLLLDSPLAITSNPGSLVSIAAVRLKYAGLVGSDLIAQPAANHIGVPVATVAREATATLVPNSLEIAITASGLSPAKAQAVADAVSQSLIDYLHNEQVSLPLISPDLRLQLKVVTPAYPGYRTAPNHRRELTTGGIYGLIALVLAYVITRGVQGVGRRASAG